MRDIKLFTIFFICWIIFFSMFYHISGVTFEDGDYPHIGPVVVTFLQSYRNSIGDLAPPKYPLWDSSITSEDPIENLKGHMMITIIWGIWIGHQFVVLVLLLNFLIAIIS